MGIVTSWIPLILIKLLNWARLEERHWEGYHALKSLDDCWKVIQRTVIEDRNEFCIVDFALCRLCQIKLLQTSIANTDVLYNIFSVNIRISYFTVSFVIPLLKEEVVNFKYIQNNWVESLPILYIYLCAHTYIHTHTHTLASTHTI